MTAPTTAPAFKHGRGGYVNHGCRCEVCREANRTYNRKAWTEDRRPLVPKVCPECGRDFKARHAAVYCSRECVAGLRPVSFKRPMARRMAHLIEDEDWYAVEAALLARTVGEDDCMVWTGQVRDGYPKTKVDGKHVLVHRLMLRAKHNGLDLGVVHAHHTCGRSECINPDHLQPVTARDNVAEMLARQSYLARIEELEDAIRALDPDHEVLNRVPLDGSL